MSTQARHLEATHNPAEVSHGSMRGKALAAAIAFLAAALAGCASQERLTAKAVNCGTREVSVIPSVFSRKGTETAWCATCRGKVYRCATNAQRSRVDCQLSREGDGCGG